MTVQTTLVDPTPPGDSIFTQGGTAPAAAEPPANAQAAVDNVGEIKKPLYEGLGVSLNTPEELVEYTKKIEGKMVEATMAAQRNTNQTNNMTTFNHTPEIPKAAATDPSDIENLIFTNPKKALEIYGDKIKKDINEQNAAKAREEKFWADFYTENPDLRNADRIVKSITGERWEQISKLPLAEAKKVIVQESRSLVTKIKGETGGTKTDLQRTNAQALPPSGGTIPVAAVTQDGPTTFVAEIKRMRAKRNA